MIGFVNVKFLVSQKLTFQKSKDDVNKVQMYTVDFEVISYTFSHPPKIKVTTFQIAIWKKSDCSKKKKKDTMFLKYIYLHFKYK